jgi:type I restriction enzyme M protein
LITRDNYVGRGTPDVTLNLELKKILLEKHTLEAVMSMPNDLFVDSDTLVVTCLMLFTAHKPHKESNKTTWFGYWKDDGFVKTRNGRIDINHKWKDIQNNWVKSFIERESIENVSIKKRVDYTDEWCYELHAVTNYSTLTEKKFIISMKDYNLYLFANSLSESIYDKPLNEKIKFNLKDFNWKKFRIDDYFYVYTGGDKPRGYNEFHSQGVLVNSIENQTTNNGIVEKIYYNGDKKFKNFISVVSIGDGGHAFYQPELSAFFTRVKALVPKDNVILNQYTAMFLITILKLEKFRYSYGRVLDADRLKQAQIKLFATKNNEPDWDLMEKFIKSLPYSYSI